jgi:hypothetical protein
LFTVYYYIIIVLDLLYSNANALYLHRTAAVLSLSRIRESPSTRAKLRKL